jgi:hypothetical protein
MLNCAAPDAGSEQLGVRHMPVLAADQRCQSAAASTMNNLNAAARAATGSRFFIHVMDNPDPGASAPAQSTLFRSAE